MNYFVSPPPVTRLPKFLYKFYAAQIFGSLMKWAENEYNRAVDHANRNGHFRTATTLHKEWSGMRVLSQMEGFRYVCAQLDDKTWNTLPKKTRTFIRKSYELFELLRKTKNA